MASTTTQTCGGCGGSLPDRDTWEANRDQADDCTGSVDASGRCRAFSRDELWEIGIDDLREIVDARREE